MITNFLKGAIDVAQGIGSAVASYKVPDIGGLREAVDGAITVVAETSKNAVEAIAEKTEMAKNAAIDAIHDATKRDENV